MKEFFSNDIGIMFEAWGLFHFIPLALVVIGVFLIYYFREPLRNYKHEKYVRYGLGILGITLELSLHTWKIANNDWNIIDDLPVGLCAFSLFMAIYVMFTKSYKVFEIAYFWSIGGVVSVLFPDILYGPDRYRYYHFLLSHMLFFYMYMYMLFVHKFVPTFQSFKKSFLLLLGIVLLIIVPVNLITGTNYMYLREPGDTPFTIFYGHGYPLYLIGCIGLAMIVITVWYSPLYIYEKFVSKGGKQ